MRPLPCLGGQPGLTPAQHGMEVLESGWPPGLGPPATCHLSWLLRRRSWLGSAAAPGWFRAPEAPATSVGVLTLVLGETAPGHAGKCAWICVLGGGGATEAEAVQLLGEAGRVGSWVHRREALSLLLTLLCSPPIGDRLHQDGERAEHSHKAGTASSDARAAGGPPEGESVPPRAGGAWERPGAAEGPLPHRPGPPVLLTAFSPRPRSTPWSRASRVCW